MTKRTWSFIHNATKPAELETHYHESHLCGLGTVFDGQHTENQRDTNMQNDLRFHQPNVGRLRYRRFTGRELYAVIPGRGMKTQVFVDG
jgi:hypothetical protein